MDIHTHRRKRRRAKLQLLNRGRGGPAVRRHARIAGRTGSAWLKRTPSSAPSGYTSSAQIKVAVARIFEVLIRMDEPERGEG